MKDIFRLYGYILKLKKLKRRGWLLRNIRDPESVADHSFSVSMLTLVMAEKLKLDTEKCLMMALLHDIGESEIGDITPDDKESSRKDKIEKKAVEDIAEKTGLIFISEMWNEFSESKTKEAKLVHDMDKIEMLLQAVAYEKENQDKNLDEFFGYVKDKMHLKESKRLYEHLIKMRAKQD